MSLSYTLKTVACVLIFTRQLAAYKNLFATKGQHFETTLNKDTFFPGENNVEFTVSLDEMPDLPTWLKFQQEDPSADGVLYGTPDNKADTVGLSIVAWNKETYETAREIVLLSVLDRTPNITQEVEFEVNGDPLSLVGNLQPLLKVVGSIWKGLDHISYVDKSSERGLKPGQGIFVGICGKSKFSDELRELIDNSKSRRCDKSHKNEIKKKFIDAGFDIDWCSFADVTNKPRSKDDRKFNFDESSQYFDTVLETTKWDDSTSDLTIDLVYVLIAVFFGLLLIAFVTSVMFCHREGLQSNLTPKEQLLHHKALRRVGAEIRNMSPGKDDSRNGFPYGKLDEDSKNGTLSSKKPGSESEASPSPPPYRHQDSKF